MTDEQRKLAYLALAIVSLIGAGVAGYFKQAEVALSFGILFAYARGALGVRRPGDTPPAGGVP